MRNWVLGRPPVVQDRRASGFIVMRWVGGSIRFQPGAGSGAFCEFREAHRGNLLTPDLRPSRMDTDSGERGRQPLNPSPLAPVLGGEGIVPPGLTPPARPH